MAMLTHNLKKIAEHGRRAAATLRPSFWVRPDVEARDP
jgi:hypothetical protein